MRNLIILAEPLHLGVFIFCFQKTSGHLGFFYKLYIFVYVNYGKMTSNNGRLVDLPGPLCYKTSCRFNCILYRSIGPNPTGSDK